MGGVSTELLPLDNIDNNTATNNNFERNDVPPLTAPVSPIVQPVSASASTVAFHPDDKSPSPVEQARLETAKAAVTPTTATEKLNLTDSTTPTYTLGQSIMSFFDGSPRPEDLSG